MKKIFIIMLYFSVFLFAEDFTEILTNEVSEENLIVSYESIYDAIDNYDAEYIRTAISNGNININSKLPDDYTNNLGGATPLLYSIYKNAGEITEILIENGANLKARDFKTWNSIMYAAAFSDLNTISLLAEKDSTLLDTKTEFNVTPLHIACDYNNLETVMYLCTNSNIDINARDIDGWTALYHAAHSKSMETYNLLIILGADTNIGDNNNVLPETVLTRKIEDEVNELRDIDIELFKAIENDDYRNIRALINRGANINAKDGYGLSALHLAIKNNSFKSVDVLLANKNIDLESKLPEGYFTHLGDDSTDAVYIGKATPLIYAIFKSKGDSRIFNELMKKGANVNATDEEGWTTFLYAAAFGNTSMLRSIAYKNRKLVNSKTKNNVTPLHMAVVYDNIDNIKYLVRNLKVDINAKDDDGWTALYYAAANNKKEAYKLLLRLGADKDIANNEGLKPADVLR
ncbi:ankyrin [Brachyspira hyodysenteriae]|uniref:ankyrin repeat domain-containing protein n=1 Tax=Brachyspira hyodysenteriae TaxID=159 RepID=UPI00063DB451|nr:ankyrin repeat domain-containing protein [Brachyspira hyodysenteriae]KLI36373.1 ankyrin [Brachyspira hyodysenteriae]